MSDEDSGKTASGLMPFTLVTSVATTDATITQSSSSKTSSNEDGITTVANTSVTPAVVSESTTKVSLSESVGAEEVTYTTAVGVQGEESVDKEKGEPVKETTEVKPIDTSVSEHQGKDAQEAEVFPSSSSKDQTSNNSEERGTLLIRLRKCPPTSSTNGSERTEMTFVQQEASKNDSYCWICHEGGEVLCCDKCPRVLHLRCSNLTSEPEGDEWNCPTCRGIAKKQKRSQPPNLKELLSLAVKRMMFPGTELFQMEVTEAIAPGYRDHVFFPMDLGTIKKNVEAGKYHSTKEFLADTEWILHNCIIYNGARHILTKTAKAIVRIAKDDMKEIELCANCYKLSVLQPTDWFAVPCVPPHHVVLAKVRGYPLWPAKLLSKSSDRCDVRFFGQHDRAIVSGAGIQELKGQPPPPPNRHIHWNQAMHELTKYRESIKEMRATLSEKDLEHFFGKQGQFANLKFQKVSSKYLESSGPKRDQLERSVSPHPSSGSSYEPFSPQVVEVKVNVDPDSESRSSDPMYPPMSSPDSEPELKIDIDYEPEPKRKKDSKRPTAHSVSPQPRKTEKSKGNFSSKKNYHPTGLGLVGNKNKGAIHATGVHFTKKAPSSDSPQKLIPTPTGFKPTKGAPGSMLTNLAAHLAEKKRAEMNGFQDSPKKAKQMPAVVVTPSKTLITEDTQGEEELKSAFSRVYPPEKTAIAVVDPDNKRVRKRKQVYTGTPDLPSKRKPITTQANSPVRPQVTSSTSSKSIPSNVSHVKSLVQGAGLTFDDISAIWGETGSGVASEGASPNIILEPETSSDSEPEDDTQGGLLETTIRHIRQAFTTRVKSLRGKSTNDMGYRYYSEKMMSAVQHVLLEMLSDYHGGPESLELKEKLKSSWPIGVGMASALDSLRKDLKKEMESQLQMVRTAADVEREQVIAEVRRQTETEKNLAVEEAIMDTKKNVWCRNCWKEAIYSCCWNTHYCSEECQVQHWPEHYPEHDQHLSSNTPQQPQPQPSAPPPRTPGFDSSAGGGGSTFNFSMAAAPTAIRMAPAPRGSSGSFPSPHPATSTTTFAFNQMFSVAPNQNTNNTGVTAITTGALGSAGPPPLTPAPAPTETTTSRMGPQPIPAEITTQPINFQLMSAGRLDQLYQPPPPPPPASSITQSIHGWTLMTAPSIVTNHASQGHPPVLQRSNQSIFYN